jgi:peptidyl-prolyl cis-trans isomerase SurA
MDVPRQTAGSERDLLRAVNLISRYTTQIHLGSAAALAVAATVALTASAQVQAPRYQSPIAAPRPQPGFTMPQAPAITPNGTVVEDVIVRVNDQIIDRSDYIRAEQQLLQDAEQKNMTAYDLEQAQKELLRDLIDQQLLLSRGKELDINADSEVIRQLDAIRKDHNFDSMEQLEKAVTDSGISYEDFKSNIKNGIITQQVIGDEVGRKLILTAKEEQAYYDAHKQDFALPEQVRLSEILIPTPDGPTDAQIAQAQAKAHEVVAKLKAGGNFDDLAKQYSGGPNADIGGDLGQFKRGALPKVLEDQTFPLKAGESTAPIRTRQGFVVLKVTDHQDAGVPPMSAIDDQLKEAIYREAIQPALRIYLTDLREKAYIDIAPGYVDTGASPKETKPVYAAYVPPSPKPKKAEEKLRLDRNATAVAPATASAAAKPAPAASTAATGAVVSSAANPPARTVKIASSKKQKRVRREKVRYGQAPRNSLPAGPEETLATGTDQGPGAASTALPPGTSIAPIAEANVDPDAAPLAAKAPAKKTRYSEHPVEPKAPPVPKIVKAAAVPAPVTAEVKVKQKVQDAPLGLGGDTATKKKPVKDKNAPKQRLEDKPPAPPAPKPDATPIPPKSVRDNGEPVVTPPPDPSTLPPVAAPPTVTPPANP